MPLYITLFDITGRPLETYHHTSTLDISHHPQGSYLVELHLPNGQVHRLKLIKEQPLPSGIVQPLSRFPKLRVVTMLFAPHKQHVYDV